MQQCLRHRLLDLGPGGLVANPLPADRIREGDVAGRLSFTTLLGTQGERVLIGTNIPIKFFKQLKSYSTGQVIWRDAATGKELASSDQFPRCPPAFSSSPATADCSAS